MIKTTLEMATEPVSVSTKAVEKEQSYSDFLLQQNEAILARRAKTCQKLLTPPLMRVEIQYYSHKTSSDFNGDVERVSVCHINANIAKQLVEFASKFSSQTAYFADRKWCKVNKVAITVRESDVVLSHVVQK